MLKQNRSMQNNTDRRPRIPSKNTQCQKTKALFRAVRHKKKPPSASLADVADGAYTPGSRSCQMVYGDFVSPACFKKVVGYQAPSLFLPRRRAEPADTGATFVDRPNRGYRSLRPNWTVGTGKSCPRPAPLSMSSHW